MEKEMKKGGNSVQNRCRRPSDGVGGYDGNVPIALTLFFMYCFDTK